MLSIIDKGGIELMLAQTSARQESAAVTIITRI